ncbi:bifunctional homocysteine S-methyltransferase/methylenetetrahydrofolate reductase [Candidatus Soleaferrea massiliensis]|uniref:bifunctional homocysteine S-methyltransferase/methylenetetrahydrofolate reductase n=1 Tax=Candidatus Soleaferrea massiliensis TaxID=1470354 RepID=UPI00058CA216|nr:bifunctional homocysteine S-methyltransferase/methylenetetrahydrofolate reductase [Candidatus Soleaferrea massiliensis]
MIFDRPYLLFDGAMGSYYASLTNTDIPFCEVANAENPALIEHIHREYIEAGAQAIKTNTFSCNTVSLNRSFDEVEPLIRAGWMIAQRAVWGTRVHVFADIGPVSHDDELSITEQYRKIIDVFLDCGAKHFLFETFSGYKHLVQALDYLKKNCPDAFVITSFAVAPDGFTRKGVSGHKILQRLGKNPNIDALGFNCISGPNHLLQYIQKLDWGDRPFSVMPNAGYPIVTNERTVFNNNPSYFAMKMLEIQKQGVFFLGGCCGTTPEHIRQTARLLREESTGQAVSGQPVIYVDHQPESENALLRKLKAGVKPVAVELDPPADTDISFILRASRELKEQGADVITVADCPIARARVDSSVLAIKIAREIGIDTLPHMACRDRNTNATKALLLGLSVEKISNVLIVTGDPISQADRGEVKGVFNMNSSVLASFITDLNRTIFSHNPFFLIGALNVNAANFEAELKRAKLKEERGVQAFFTQPAFTDRAFENLRMAKECLNAYLFGGIMPIVSYKSACFIANEIAGMELTEEIIALYEDKTREECAEIAVSLSLSNAKRMKDMVDGYYCITPFKRSDIMGEIVRALKAREYQE